MPFYLISAHNTGKRGTVAKCKRGGSEELATYQRKTILTEPWCPWLSRNGDMAEKRRDCSRESTLLSRSIYNRLHRLGLDMDPYRAHEVQIS